MLFYCYQSYHWYQWRPFLSSLTPMESICEYWTTLRLSTYSSRKNDLGSRSEIILVYNQITNGRQRNKNNNKPLPFSKRKARGTRWLTTLPSDLRSERCTGPHVSHFNLKLGGKKTEINNRGWRICQRVKRTPFEAVLVPDLKDGVAEGWEGGVEAGNPTKLILDKTEAQTE